MVAADAEASVAQVPDGGFVKGGVGFAAINDDEIIAQAVHLGERKGHDGASHRASCGLTHEEHTLISTGQSGGDGYERHGTG
ncbi:hypothetical protein GCM10007867_17270 [Gluconobacter cerinus]|uniref:Uncharacterized protein n=1 Tax=Gluconobacter cerinus TaxID=38307 RepID=A0AAV5NG34_9PROT|nr:hypothetical protein GCM10007867_17270 [Gluconobacter cerinus]